MQQMKKPPSKIIILGGGTAGWMAANWIQHKWAAMGTKVTLIESEEIGIIGVGEGTTPYFRYFFRDLGVPESEWMPECNATFKAGISFPNWSDTPDNKTYFHPFFTHLDVQTGEAFFYNACLRRRGSDVPAHPDDFFVTAALARNYQAPVPRHAMTHEPDYAYHFDSGLLGMYLKKRAIKLGVEHIVDTVTQVQQSDDGSIAGLYLKSCGFISADFFIDSSGFASLLLGKTLNEKFISFKNNLFNDRAIAMPTSLDNRQDIPAETVSAAMKCGWSWKIPLVNRFGNGYVYSSDFLSEDQAEQELRNHLGDAAKGQEARHLRMRVGRVENHWSKNCLGLGLSQGFIEPLEATALMLVQFTIQMFVDLYESADSVLDAQQTLNKKINKMFDGVRDYIVAHYHLNTRTDTEYWRANREHRHHSEELKAILQAWDKGLDFEAQLTELRDTQVYMRPSWYCILAGMGRFSQVQPPKSSIKWIDRHEARKHCEITAMKLFPKHRNYLRALYGERWMDYGA